MANIDAARKIVSRVEKRGGVLSVTGRQLRDWYGYGRLGIHVRAEIQDDLDSLGVRTFPSLREINDQQAAIRLYQAKSAAGRLVEAALEPGDREDAYLLAHIDREAEALLDRIREMLDGVNRDKA